MERMKTVMSDKPIATLEMVKDINDKFRSLLLDRHRILILYGGAGAGKSYFAGQKILSYVIRYSNKKILVLRKTFPALRLTCLELLESLFSKYNIPYNLNRSDFILYTINKNKIIFKSLDDPDKLKSLSDVDLIWVEEPTELTRYEFDMVLLRLRGANLSQDEYRQIILTFNPISKTHWIYEKFFTVDDDNVYKRKFTYKDNKFIDNEYRQMLESLKEQNQYLYNVYCLGEWGIPKGAVYDNYVVEAFDYDVNWYDDIIAGVDFGYNNPSAYLLIGLKDRDIYVIDEVYKSHLTNSELTDLIKAKNSEWGVNPVIYCETEPARAQEFSLAGMKTVVARKDVADGINFVRSRKLHLHPRCVNTIKEIQGYRYKEDKDGNVLEEPVKFNDHACDALRYAVYTYGNVNKIMDKPKGW